MRLIDTKSFALRPPSARPSRYAILSHTWGDDEATFQKYEATSGERTFPSNSQGNWPKGWHKVRNGIVTAREQGYGYLWVDTCCIDKTNSTELSEAINSMFRWYAEAEICFAYLADVPGDDPISHRHSSFRASRWFTRGWTLQELLAPKEVHFYSKDWKFLGSRTDLKEIISSITGIPEDVLTSGQCQAPARSIGEIFSWASRRTTTLEEDMAYSLLGLLNINMPLIYGEGSTAFMRVQEEILKRYDDESIFAWEAPPNQAITKPLHGLLSPSVTYFQASHRFLKPRIRTRLDSGPVLVTNKGIAVDLLLAQKCEIGGQTLALLNCRIAGTDEAVVQPAIRVQHLGGKSYARIDVHHIHDVRVSTLTFQECGRAICPMLFSQHPQDLMPVTAFMFRTEGVIFKAVIRQGDVSHIILDTSPEGSWRKDLSSKMLGIDYELQSMNFNTSYRPQPRNGSTGADEVGQRTSPSVVGGLKVGIYRNSKHAGSVYILCGLDQPYLSTADAPKHVVPWCCILPAPGTTDNDGSLLKKLPRGPRSEWPTKLQLPDNEFLLSSLAVTVRLAERQGPGRVVYEIILERSSSLV